MEAKTTVEEPQTEYEALRRFAKVTASTQELRTFAKVLMETPKENWKFYLEDITTGNQVKPQNQELLDHTIKLTELMELYDIEITLRMLKVVLHLELIAKKGQIVSNWIPTAELYIARSEKAMQEIDMQVISKYGLNLDDIWAYWLYEFEEGTFYKEGDTTGQMIPKVFLGENKTSTQNHLIAKYDRKKRVLQRLIETHKEFPFEIPSFLNHVWNEFPALRTAMAEYGYNPK